MKITIALLTILFLNCSIAEDNFIGPGKDVYLCHIYSESDKYSFMAIEFSDNPFKIIKLRNCKLLPNLAEKLGEVIFGSGQYKDMYYKIKGDVKLAEDNITIVIVPIENTFEKLDIGQAQVMSCELTNYKKLNSLK